MLLCSSNICDMVLSRLTLKTPTPQNGQTHSNNSSAVGDELFECDHFVGLALKGLKLTLFFTMFPFDCSRENQKTFCFPMFSRGIKREHLKEMDWIEKWKSYAYNPFQTVTFYIETNYLFFSAKQMTGFYMKRNTGLKWVKATTTIPTNINLFKASNRNLKSNAWNLFRVNNKDTWMTSMTSFRCLYS